MHSIMKISRSAIALKQVTPTLERPRIATSGLSGGGSSENLPTVKRRIGAGEKNLAAGRSLAFERDSLLPPSRKKVGNGGLERLIQVSRN
jgi:hypothetical protein